ncbi:MAG TPA: hypothetical protein VEL77_15075 [Rugosimonospora sp.]|nr:hypothetical protein [Rugosimonospora sp.]
MTVQEYARERFRKWIEKIDAENALPLFVYATDAGGRPLLLGDGNMSMEELRALVRDLAQIIEHAQFVKGIVQ